MKRPKSIIKSKTLFERLVEGELESGGDKIKGIGKKRRKYVMQRVASAYDRRAYVENAAKNIKKDAEVKDHERDWKRVVVTELTAAKARASIDMIKEIFGTSATVYRLANPECCPLCSKAYGKPPHYKKFKASEIPANLVGALHPNCICGPWVSVDQPDLTKAMSPLADIPMGVVKRVSNNGVWEAHVSTGNGYWVELGSITGRAIIRVIANHVPLIFQRAENGYSVWRHGSLKTSGKYRLIDFRKIGTARFYSMDPGEKFPADKDWSETSGTKTRTLDQYIEHLKAVIPTVALMPEYWENGHKLRYLSDFFGYRTLTDWVIVVPGKIPQSAEVGQFDARHISVRKMVRQVTSALVDGDSVQKATAGVRKRL